MKTHNLKTVNPYFSQVWDGDKTFEIRNNDMDFQVGDDVILREYDSGMDLYKPRAIKVRITHILKDSPAIISYHVVFSFRIIHRFDNADF